MEEEFSIEFPVFGYKLYVVMTDNIKKSRKRIKALPKYEKGTVSKWVDGLHSFDDGNAESFIFFYPETSPGVIAHEVFHFLWRMFKYYECEFDNETYAYHLSYTLDEILKWKDGVLTTKEQAGTGEG